MAKLLLIICAVFTMQLAPALAQVSDGQGAPAASLIRPYPPSEHVPRPRVAERPRPRPIDERCRAMKDQLEAELQRAGNARRAFQARLAHNAGTRLCREGHPEKGMAEFQRGLSYLQEGPRY